MKHFNLIISISLLTIVSCGNPIKSNEKVIIEEGTELIITSDTVILEEIMEDTIPEIKKIAPITDSHLIGSWVGYFRKDSKRNFDKKKDIYFDEYYWGRENKINLSIDEIFGDKVIGHSVVAGNNRPFEGNLILDSINSVYTIEVKEPGDDKYDGVFKFSISNNELVGTWKAYKIIDISKRIYKLKRMTLVYDTSVQIGYSKAYVDWNDSKTETKSEGPEGQDEEWVRDIYSTSTEMIYKVNASSKLLTEEIVENLTKGDLKIIRNSIYARHGYSFKNRQLRIFFDAQKWYIPIHTDIRKELTDIEKRNIKLLLKYEKNAVEYYDFFGRG